MRVHCFDNCCYKTWDQKKTEAISYKFIDHLKNLPSQKFHK
ncbi:unnamed protein product [Callosobruchus maculatus]|uniref:Uncharacterized protein n=1 Tax=Callosobruchus maculatus TaxID=64391 RepID=A0A653DVH8_CALMS|nr:unnamed protein product [Callosobruchus maculatus]